MLVDAQKLVLTVPVSKMESFLDLLRKLEFVKVESLDEIIRHYSDCTQNHQGDDEEIADILSDLRYGQSKQR